LCAASGLKWAEAIDLTLTQARRLCAACERRDAARSLTDMRCFMAAGSALLSKAGANAYRAMERHLEATITRPAEQPPAAERAKALAKLARKAGARNG
jgi:DNA-binding GntR family transcriptional regulator